MSRRIASTDAINGSKTETMTNATNAIAITQIDNVSRRGFLKGAAAASAFVLALRYSSVSASAAAAPPTYAGPHVDHSVFHPDVYLGIDSDGTVYLIAHRSSL